LEEKRESAPFDLTPAQRRLLIESVILTLMGPFGIIRLLRKNLIDRWQLAGTLFVWAAFFWCRWITGFNVLSVAYEMFTIGLFTYGVIVTYPSKSEVDKITICLVTLIFLLIAITGYSEILLARKVSNFSSPVDLFVIGNGLAWYAVITYRALLRQKKRIEND